MYSFPSKWTQENHFKYRPCLKFITVVLVLPFILHQCEFCEMMPNIFSSRLKITHCQSNRITTTRFVRIVRADWAQWHHRGNQTAGVSEINHMRILPCIFYPGILQKRSAKIPILLSARRFSVVDHSLGELLHCSFSHSCPPLLAFLLFPFLFVLEDVGRDANSP